MANEPERPIEQLLRAAAKKRRDEAGEPLELHPATRRLLQGEVARQYAKPQPDTRRLFPLFVQLWPRFAWAVAIFAVLGVAVWVFLPGLGGDEQEALLAKNDDLRELRLSKESPPLLATSPTAPSPQPEP